MTSTLFTDWLEAVVSSTRDVPLYRERRNARSIGLMQLAKLLIEHFVGQDTVLKMGGYTKAANTIRNSLPTTKRTRSGDLGELIATEYVDSHTAFTVPIRKLRWKSDRKMPMHGNDIIAVETRRGRVRVLKGECKSAAKLSTRTVKDAADGLDRDEGRPNPSTLAFIVKRLYEAGRDAEGKVFEQLQAAGTLRARDVQHLIFTLTGNDPSDMLAATPAPQRPGIQRRVAAVMIPDHGEFVEAVFAEDGPKP